MEPLNPMPLLSKEHNRGHLTVVFEDKSDHIPLIFILDRYCILAAAQFEYLYY